MTRQFLQPAFASFVRFRTMSVNRDKVSKKKVMYISRYNKYTIMPGQCVGVKPFPLSFVLCICTCTATATTAIVNFLVLPLVYSYVQ